ncbi:MAG: AGE family epimerase/isomerase [Tannerella sp.]|jgi:N-acylglucosamine 2-epimerase|nr:AGE family epimerase/isomerase [Tannerella sp.]
MDLKALKELYKSELFDNVLPFWLQHSPDNDYGGYFTCLARDGSVFDTDKFIWLQARQVWTFSMLYNNVERRQEWLDFAVVGSEFLRKYGHDGSFNWYFSLTREGKPLVQPYNIFSDCFATMAFGELYKATGDEMHRQIAVDTYRNIIRRKDHPKGKYCKTVPETRPLKNFALPMILSNLSLILEEVIGTEEVDSLLHPLVKEITTHFYNREAGLVFENVAPDGSLSDSFEGRLLNPGHTCEAMWFLMDIGVRFQDRKLIDFAVETTLRTIDFGWDREFGGMFYFLDYKGYPPQQLEWDQKLWWVHIETMIALLKGYHLTDNPDCLRWFETFHNYTWEHFKDREYPEWFGYLNRQGAPLLTLKGGKWKGCFHVPRGLYQLYTTPDNTLKLT